MNKKIILFIVFVIFAIGAAGYYYYFKYGKPDLEESGFQIPQELSMEESLAKLGHPEDNLLVRGVIKEVNYKEQLLNVEIGSVANFLLLNETNPFGEKANFAIDSETKIFGAQTLQGAQETIEPQKINNLLKNAIPLSSFKVGDQITLYVPRTETDKGDYFEATGIVLENK